MAVISPAGVVGRLILPSRRASKVQLLIDRNAAAGALIERTRVQGVVMGIGDGMLRMQYVPGTSDVKTGDLVVTSGIDGIYPKGFVIGTIDHADRGAGAYHEIIVRPAVDFSRLEGVLIVRTPRRFARHGRGAREMRSAVALAAIVIAIAVQTTLASIVSRQQHGDRPGPDRGGVCRDQVGSGRPGFSRARSPA